MKINAYLNFNGDCKTAFECYAQCFRGKITMISHFADAPASMCEQIPAEFHDKVMHARLEIGDQVLMGSDSAPPCPYEGIKGCSMAIAIDDPAEAERIFNTLAENGTVQMPLDETFWAKKFGMLTDRFGVAWMINCGMKS
ncbi:VOC family protein [Dyella tabacisoli]|uniref:VOC family protein n=1 Tax=Dyella tabacisoli TaxID=2282381 RepID=A0A369UTW6_9GAMM|nr:VOC family protein [Dyella tabacisoli]RDD81779.1 VOC family protein [Dyella tabacisoli]